MALTVNQLENKPYKFVDKEGRVNVVLLDVFKSRSGGVNVIRIKPEGRPPVIYVTMGEVNDYIRQNKRQGCHYDKNGFEKNIVVNAGSVRAGKHINYLQSFIGKELIITNDYPLTNIVKNSTGSNLIFEINPGTAYLPADSKGVINAYDLNTASYLVYFNDKEKGLDCLVSFSSGFIFECFKVS